MKWFLLCLCRPFLEKATKNAVCYRKRGNSAGAIIRPSEDRFRGIGKLMLGQSGIRWEQLNVDSLLVHVHTNAHVIFLTRDLTYTTSHTTPGEQLLSNADFPGFYLKNQHCSEACSPCVMRTIMYVRPRYRFWWGRVLNHVWLMHFPLTLMLHAYLKCLLWFLRFPL